MNKFQSFINYIGSTRAKQRRNLMLTATLSILVLFVVSFLLIQPADSMSGELICGKEIHSHTDTCSELICTIPEHICDENCIATACTKGHVHSNECYGFVCGYEEHEHSQECYKQEELLFMSTFYDNGINIMADDEIEYFDKVPTTLPANAMDVFPYIINDEYYPTKILSEGGPVNDNKEVEFSVSFQIYRSEILSIINGSDAENENYNNYLYYKLPDGVTFKAEDYGSTLLACKTELGVDIPTAYYTFTNSINGESYIVLRLIDDYISNEFVEQQANSYICKVTFNGIVTRDNSTNSGDRTVKLSNDITPVVEFNDYSASIQKWGQRVEGDDGKQYAEWVLTIYNPAPKTLLTSGYYITDDMLNSIVDGSFTVTPSGAASLQTVDGTQKKIVFNQEASADENYTIKITYRTEITKDIFYKAEEKDRTLTNKAVLTNGSDSYDCNYSFSVPRMGIIHKWAGKDYQLSTNPVVGNEIYWYVQIETALKEELGGYSVTDKYLTAGMQNVTVTDENNNTISADKYTITDGKITFAEDVTATKLQIAYKTSKENDENTAQIHYPQPNDNEIGPSVNATMNNYKPYALSKTGYYDDGKVKWTVTITPNDGSQANIYGLKVHDELFSDITTTDGKKNVTITTYRQHGNNTENVKYDWSADGDTLTFSKPENGTGEVPNSVRIEFTTAPNAEQQALIDAVQPVTFENIADIDQNGYTDQTELATVTYTPIKEINKKLVSPTGSESWNQNETFTPKVLTWTVEMCQDTGFTSSSAAFIDIIQAIDKSTNAPSTEASHHLTVAQRGEIQIYAKEKKSDEWPTTPVTNTADTTYYTITYYSDTEGTIEATSAQDAKSFKITFDDTNFKTSDGKKYTAVKIDYKTTADMTNVTNFATIEFSNKAQFQGQESKPNGYIIDSYKPDEQPYSKVPIDVTTEEEIQHDSANPLNLNDAKKIIENGVSYYVFGWKIEFAKYIQSKEITITDTFDDAFELCTNGAYAPKRKYNWETAYTGIGRTNEEAAWNAYKYTDGSNVVSFTRTTSVDYIVYFIKVPASEFKNTVLEKVDINETYLLKNSVIESLDNKYDPVTSQIHITAEHDPILPEAAEIEKEYIPHENGTVQYDKGNNNIKYSLEINNHAKDLANGDSIILNDAFITKSFTSSGNTQTGNSLIKTVLNYVKVYEVNASGDKILLPASEYSYQYYEEGISTDTFVPDIDIYNNYHPNRRTIYKNLQGGDIFTFTLKADPYFENLNYYNNTQNYFDVRLSGNNVQQISYRLNETSPMVFDENGLYTYTITIPDNYTSIDVDSWSYVFESMEATVTRKIATSELALILPDAKHLYIEYSYQLLNGVKRPNSGDKLVFSNTATITANTTASDSTDDTELTFEYGSAESSSKFLPRINKLDVADHTITGLNAAFQIAKYDSDNNNWLWYTGSLQNEGTLSSHLWGAKEDAFTFQTVNSEFKFSSLEEGKLYALKEITKPTHDKYTYEEVNDIETYYFSYVTLPGTYPQGIDGETLSKDNVSKIQYGGVIPVTNNRIIDVNVKKHWTEPHDDAIIKAKLYWSYTKKVTDFPDEMKLATAEDLGIKNLDNTVEFTDSYKWSGLPNGINGKPIYYYVKEMGYTIDGTSYKTSDDVDATLEIGDFLPFYIGNGVNDSSQLITITNADALHIEKKWNDNQNNPLPEHYLPDSIEFKLWARVKDNGAEVLIKNGESDTFTIKAENDWIYEFDSSLINGYNYFRVEEVNVADEYVVSYNLNYNGPTGIITIINKNTEIEIPQTQIVVEKNWHDGGGTNRPDSLTLTLQSSADKSSWTNVDGISPTISQDPDNTDIVRYIYPDLPYRNNNGNILYYRVIETVPSGYICTYSNNEGISHGTIQLTNTRVITVGITKQWSDSYKRDHSDDSINVTLYRSTLESDVTKGTDSSCILKTLKIKESDSWAAEIQNLEAYAPDGTPYYYWIKENEAEFPSYKAVYNYSGTRNDAITEDNGTVIISNNYIYPPAKLPSTGSTGKTIYYVMGMIAIVIGCSLYIAHYIKYEKRRKEN